MIAIVAHQWSRIKVLPSVFQKYNDRDEKSKILFLTFYFQFLYQKYIIIKIVYFLHQSKTYAAQYKFEFKKKIQN